MPLRAAVVLCCALTAVPLTALPAQARGRSPEAVPALLSQQAAMALVRAAGITLISSGHCARRSNPHCTSLDGVRSSTVGGLVALREASHCRVAVTGGTEAGHAHLRYGHGDGYKVDLLRNRCLGRFIHRHFRRIGRRGDGAAQWRAPDPATFAREGSHWDVTFA
jgi:hypothetical protein